MKKKLFLHFRIKTTMLESNREYKDFFEAHFEAVWRFARQIVNDGDVAQDIAQDAFVRLYEHRKDFDVLEKARSFVYLTARNLAVDWLRGQKVVDRYIAMHEEEPIDLPCLHEITYQETLRLLRKAIHALPPQMREIILLTLDDKSNNEIAEALRVSVNTVKTQKKTAYRKLKKMLGKDFVYFLAFLP